MHSEETTISESTKISKGIFDDLDFVLEGLIWNICTHVNSFTDNHLEEFSILLGLIKKLGLSLGTYRDVIIRLPILLKHKYVLSRKSDIEIYNILFCEGDLGDSLKSDYQHLRGKTDPESIAIIEIIDLEIPSECNWDLGQYTNQ